jgi:hypothetical protein
MEYYAEACKNPNFNEDELQLYRYFKEMFERYLSFAFKKDEDENIGEYTSDTYLSFERSVDRLLEKVSNEFKKT